MEFEISHHLGVPTEDPRVKGFILLVKKLKDGLARPGITNVSVKSHSKSKI